MDRKWKEKRIGQETKYGMVPTHGMIYQRHVLEDRKRMAWLKRCFELWCTC